MKVDEEEQEGGGGGRDPSLGERRGREVRAGKLWGRRVSLQSSPLRNTAVVFPAVPSLKVPLKRLNYVCFSV